MKKFDESLDTAVFTTRFVIADQAPILNIYHDEDGSWSFNGAQECTEDDDYKVIGLGEAINLDASILEVADLLLGHMAWRDQVTDEWQTAPIH